MKIKATLSIGYCGANRETTIEIDDEELEGMTTEEQERYISDEVEVWANNYIEIGWQQCD